MRKREEQMITRLEQLSGWILPDGNWYPCEDWWHIAAIYEMQEQNSPFLQKAETRKILAQGDEESIRNHLAELGFLRVSRKVVDGFFITYEQLMKLQELIQLCSPDEELGFLNSARSNSASDIKYFTIERILKLRSPHILLGNEE